MSGWKKLASAAAASGDVLNVEDVFSTYLYEGNSTARDIQNGIDLSGEGGLVWAKNRDVTHTHMLFDTERGAGSYIISNLTSQEATNLNTLASFNSDGFSLGNNNPNLSSYNYVSWTFRKAPKFFDVVQFSGNTSGVTVSHNLGSDVGFIVVKRTDSTSSWTCWHRNDGSSPLRFSLESTLAGFSAGGQWGTVDSSSFSMVSGATDTGGTYIAYLFAHNDGDGNFGPTGDQDIIKCGSYTGNNSTNGPEIDLGFEPQWIMIKNATASQSWWMHDTMRGIVTSSNGADDARLKANATTAEDTANHLHVTPTGFKLTASASGVNDSNTFIYIAIRRGPMAVPESATDVFDIDTQNSTSGSPAMKSAFPVDMATLHYTTNTLDKFITSRLTQGKRLETSSTDAEASVSEYQFDYSNGWWVQSGTNSTRISHMWRRAPNFFDVVAYTGTGSNQTISHNLGVAPKFMIVKERTTANNWVCYLEALGNDKRMALNAASAVATDTTAWQSTTPTDSAFYVGANTQTNVSGEEFIAYLFGEVAGISKIGTYTGTGAAQNIDCGFSSGARFVLTKTYAGTNPNADWNIWDSERGIVAGNDPYLALNSTSAQVASTDVIDPYSSGFSLTSSGVANNSGTSYWFYAIA